MYYGKINKEMFNIFKSSAQATLGTISTLENQTTRMANFLMDHSTALQKEGRQCVEEWIVNMKKNQAELVRAYDHWMDGVSELVCKEDQVQPQAESRPKNQQKSSNK